MHYDDLLTSISPINSHSYFMVKSSKSASPCAPWLEIPNTKPSVTSMATCFRYPSSKKSSKKLSCLAKPQIQLNNSILPLLLIIQRKLAVSSQYKDWAHARSLSKRCLLSKLLFPLPQGLPTPGLKLLHIKENAAQCNTVLGLAGT